MDISAFLTFVSDNFAPLLTAVTVLSFILNIIQYKTNRDVQYHLDSIYQSCVQSIKTGQAKDWTNDEYIHALYLIRIQSVSGLRSLGIIRGYGFYDRVTTEGRLYRYLRNTYHTLLKVKAKWPSLFGKPRTTEESKKKNSP